MEKKYKNLRDLHRDKEGFAQARAEFESYTPEQIIMLKLKSIILKEFLAEIRLAEPKQSPDEIQMTLTQFKGEETELHEADPFGALQMTEGMMFVASQVAPWIPIDIATFQSELLTKHKEASKFQIWEMNVDTKTGKGTLSVYEDMDSPPWYELHIETIINIPHLQMYVVDDTLMLASEFKGGA